MARAAWGRRRGPIATDQLILEHRELGAEWRISLVAEQLASTHTPSLWRSAPPVVSPFEQHVGLDGLSVLVADASVAADKLVAALT